MRERASPLLIAILFLLIPLNVSAAESVPEDVREYAEEIGAEYGICPEIIEAMCYEETRFTPSATSPNGKCQGIMQVNPGCHKKRMERLGVTDIYDTYGNMLVGTDYLVEILETHEDIGEALMVYNGSSGRKIENYQTTGRMTSYADRILKRSAEYERQHGK